MNLNFNFFFQFIKISEDFQFDVEIANIMITENLLTNVIFYSASKLSNTESELKSIRVIDLKGDYIRVS